MKPLIEVVEDYIENMPGFQVYSLHQSHSSYGGFYDKVAEIISDSPEYFDWLAETIEDPDNEELNVQMDFLFKRIILTYIKKHYKGTLEDKLQDHVDSEFENKNPYHSRGLSRKQFEAV